jgi:outer membrane receptor protein involved in Fe transport
MLAGASFAADGAAAPDTSAAPPPPTVSEVIVTAEKRAENIQHVALSIQAMDTKKLDQLNVSEFQDYVKFLPSVSFQTAGPNQTSIYFRGVASGENANHSGPLPSVGVYLDEQPITTIGGTLDVHIYDIARVEALAGPQGTLYGASSEAGTLRIITNKPSASHFSAGFDLEGNTVAHGGQGYTAEGFVNIPIASNAAIRLVGFDEHDAGYIDNVFGQRTFFTSGQTIDNKKYVKKDFNPADTWGGRAALKIDLDENWSIEPTVMFQDQRNTGVFGYEPNVGYLQVQRFQPDTDHDRWYQAAMTITGKLSKMDVVYSGGYFNRRQDTNSDYTDYSIFYDGVYGSGAYWQDGSGNPLAAPQQSILGRDRFEKTSHELRISSPKTDRFRMLLGLFTQRQSHWIIQDYLIQGLGSQLSVPGWDNTIWLTDQMRVDRDSAVFGEFSYDLTPQLTVTGGVRFYKYRNSLNGFYGFGDGYNALTGYSSGMGAGDVNCKTMSHDMGIPCENLDKTVEGNGETHKFNVTYKFDPERMVYFTYATGYRPGGVNRAGNLPPYAADYLSSYEIGWKTTWFDHRFRFNGAIYNEDWNNFQFSFLGLNSLTQVANAGQANVKGIESDFSWAVTRGLTISGSGAYTDAKLSSPYCATNLLPCPDKSPGSPQFVYAPAGTPLPVTPKFKGNLTARYAFDLLDWSAHVQGAVVYQDKSTPSVRNIDNSGTSSTDWVTDSSGLGILPSFTTVDFSLGAERDGYTIELFVKNAFDDHGEVTRYTPCTTKICTATNSPYYTGWTTGASLPAPAVYAVPIMPRTIGIKVGKRF